MTREQLKAAKDEWWSSVCRKGDPARRPHLVDEAFTAGYEAGTRVSSPLRGALEEARLQLEYLDSKFAPTGTTAATLARIRAALNGTSRKSGA